jgi:hypothetical protein
VFRDDPEEAAFLVSSGFTVSSTFSGCSAITVCFGGAGFVVSVISSLLSQIFALGDFSSPESPPPSETVFAFIDGFVSPKQSRGAVIGLSSKRLEFGFRLRSGSDTA